MVLSFGTSSKNATEVEFWHISPGLHRMIFTQRLFLSLLGQRQSFWDRKAPCGNAKPPTK
jgi:hypothetical protein